MLRWPDGATVVAAARDWAQRLKRDDANVIAVGCFGSYGRGEGGVGSDIDLLVIVEDAAAVPTNRCGPWATEHLPVPADVLVFSRDQWRRLQRDATRFAQVVSTQTKWLAGVDAAG